MVRLSSVDEIKIENITSSASLQIGDSRHIDLNSRALAVQKEWTSFDGDEGDLTLFDLYTQKLPQPDLSNSVHFTIENVVPIIKVAGLRAIAIAAASTVHIGSTGVIDAESRIKHFRHYADVPKGFRTRPELTIYT